MACSSRPAARQSASAAETTPDSSDVALVLDFSASILNDARNRARFAGALERMADRVDALSGDLVTGDTTVSLVQFASQARDVEGCTDLQLLNDPEAVATFADCLRTVGAAYREGLDPDARGRHRHRYELRRGHGDRAPRICPPIPSDPP